MKATEMTLTTMLQVATCRVPSQPAMTFIPAKAAISKNPDAPDPRPIWVCSAAADGVFGDFLKTP